MLMSLVFGVTEWLVEVVAVLPCLDGGDACVCHFPRWRRHSRVKTQHRCFWWVMMASLDVICSLETSLLDDHMLWFQTGIGMSLAGAPGALFRCQLTVSGIPNGGRRPTFF
jgi:hypothetical protein